MHALYGSINVDTFLYWAIIEAIKAARSEVATTPSPTPQFLVI